MQISTVARVVFSALFVVLLSSGRSATADDTRVSLRLTGGSSWQERNDVQIPNDEQGSRFSLADAVGSGPVTALRLEINWALNERHGLRLLLAPLSFTEPAFFSQTVRFAGQSFAANQAVDASYRFNSWRLGYHYALMNGESGSLRVGATLKVRDAEIRLEQGDTRSLDDDVGFVPLLYLAGNLRLSDRITLRADLDGLAGGPGRAIDLGVALDLAISRHWTVGAEVRILDGGADTDDVYNFARFNTAALAIATAF